MLTLSNKQMTYYLIQKVEVSKLRQKKKSDEFKYQKQSIISFPLLYVKAYLNKTFFFLCLCSNLAMILQPTRQENICSLTQISSEYSPAFFLFMEGNILNSNTRFLCIGNMSRLKSWWGETELYLLSFFRLESWHQNKEKPDKWKKNYNKSLPLTKNKNKNRWKSFETKKGGHKSTDSPRQISLSKALPEPPWKRRMDGWGAVKGQ